MSKKYNICLDIGGTKVLGAVFNGKDKLVCKVKRRSTDQGAESENIEAVIIEVTRLLLQKANIKKSQINAISAGVPGIVDSKNGIVVFTPNLPWRNYDLRSAIEKEFGAKFYLGNDVNVGVLGEYRYGAGRGHKNIVGFFIGTGVGGGLILNKKLYVGHEFKAGELGHLIIDENGPLCGCGNHGCLEAFSSKKGMAKYILSQIEAGRPSEMGEAIDEHGVFKSKFLKMAVEHQDQVALEAIDQACHYLAIGAGSMINALSPDCVIFGGGVIEALGDLFMEKILAEIDKYAMPAIRPSVEIMKASLGDYSNIYGALAMIKDAEKGKRK
ncbi:MAG: ROK family protein [Bacilli bacterium]|nr:ROK family protein [Bacilli bacterium]